MQKQEIEQLLTILRKQYDKNKLDPSITQSEGFMFILHPKWRFYENNEEELFQFGEITWDEIDDIEYMESGFLLHTQVKDRTYDSKTQLFEENGNFLHYSNFWPYEAIIGITTEY